jgi:hypothetical protein
MGPTVNFNSFRSVVFSDSTLAKNIFYFLKDPNRSNADSLVSTLEQFSKIHTGSSAQVLRASRLLFKFKSDEYSRLCVLELEARNSNDKKRLHDVAMGYMSFVNDFISNNLNCVKMAQSSCEQIYNLKSKLSRSSIVIACCKRAFFCAFDAGESEFAISIAKKIFTAQITLDMAELYYKSAQLCEAKYRKILKENEININNNQDITLYLTMASVFYAMAKDGSEFYVLNARAEYERLYQEKCCGPR